MLKPWEKLHKAVGGIIAILFIVSSIIIAYILIDFGLRAQQEQIETLRRTYEVRIKAINIAKAVEGIWNYRGVRLTISITNNYVEPVTITGIVILYEDGTYEVLKEDPLPYTLAPGETLEISKISAKEPVSVIFSAGTLEILTSLSAERE